MTTVKYDERKIVTLCLMFPFSMLVALLKFVECALSFHFYTPPLQAHLQTYTQKKNTHRDFEKKNAFREKWIQHHLPSLNEENEHKNVH